MINKICSMCKTMRPIAQFYKHPHMADGHFNKCKWCIKKIAEARKGEKNSGNMKELAIKKCSKCGQEKPITEFYRKSDSKTGRGPQCKACLKEYQLRYAEINSDKLVAANRVKVDQETISLSEAVKICFKITGQKVTCDFIRRRMFDFKQLGIWTVNDGGKNRLLGVRGKIFFSFIKTRMACRGTDLADIFSLED